MIERRAHNRHEKLFNQLQEEVLQLSARQGDLGKYSQFQLATDELVARHCMFSKGHFLRLLHWAQRQSQKKHASPYWPILIAVLERKAISASLPSGSILNHKRLKFRTLNATPSKVRMVWRCTCAGVKVKLLCLNPACSILKPRNKITSFAFKIVNTKTLVRLSNTVLGALPKFVLLALLETIFSFLGADLAETKWRIAIYILMAALRRLQAVSTVIKKILNYIICMCNRHRCRDRRLP